MDALSKMGKAPFTLPSWDNVNILKDPPKSIHTRKKERVNVGDVTYNLREMPDRVSDNISYYARGQNPMVSITYSNYGYTMGGPRQNVVPHTPYKVARAGAFRPPMLRPIEDLLPLSRQKRSWFAIQSKKGVNVANFQFKNLSEQTIDKPTLRSAVRPNTRWNKGGMAEETYVGNTILDPVQYMAVSALKGNKALYLREYEDDGDIGYEGYIKDKPLVSLLNGNKFNLQVYDNTTRTFVNLDMPVKDKINIVARANKSKPLQLVTPSGENIKLKDYTWKIVQSSKNAPSTFILKNNEPELKRNLPATQARTNLGKRVDDTSRNENTHNLTMNRPIVSVAGTRHNAHAGGGGVTDIERVVELKNKPRYGKYEDRSVMGVYGVRFDMTPTLEKRGRGGVKV